MDEFYMNHALEISKYAAGKVNPNPLVGAVIVKNDKIVGEGYHEYYGGPHAEINAFANSEASAENCTLYVTLEPCCHYGKTPPCVDAIIKNKIKRVVVGALDPNPLVSGEGVNILRQHGIEVTIGVLEEACKKTNEAFMKFIRTKLPFVIMKTAMTLDGKIAAVSGASKWITGEEARIEVHKLRNSMSAIMTGIGTVLSDDPLLTCRLKAGTNPKRIIVDSNLRIPLTAKVLSNQEEAPTIIATLENAPEEKLRQLLSIGISVISIPEYNGRVDLMLLMKRLGEISIDSILLEGGSTFNYSALEQRIVDKVQFYIAPKIIGGETAKTPVGGAGLSTLDASFSIHSLNIKQFGKDILIEGYIN